VTTSYNPREEFLAPIR